MVYRRNMAGSSAASIVGSRLLSQIVRKAQALSPALSRINNTMTAEEISRRFEELHGLAGKVTLDDLEYPIPGRTDWHQGGALKMPQCPCFYTEIFEDEDLTFCVFALRETNSEIPLHDHPDITGILKVLFGKVRITSYSWLKPELESKIKQPPSGFKKDLSRSESRTLRPAIFEGTGILTPNDPPALVGPRIGNIHRVQAVNGTAGIVDVLMPRYEPPERDVSYFQEVEPKDKEELKAEKQAEYCTELGKEGPVENLTWLSRVPCPMSWWCREWDYEVPEIDLEEEFHLRSTEVGRSPQLVLDWEAKRNKLKQKEAKAKWETGKNSEKIGS